MDRFDNEDSGLEHFWHPVAVSGDVVEGGVSKVTLLGVDWVVARIDGSLMALQDVCPHRLAPLSAGTVSNGVLQCCYHGYCFDSTGRCVEIPSLQGGRVPSKANARAAGGITERYGLIWLAPRAPVVEIVDVPEWNDPDYDCWFLDPIRTRVSAALLMDNFLENRHFEFIHATSFGPGQWTVINAQRNNWHLEITTRLKMGPEFRGDQSYQLRAPFSLRNISERMDGGSGTFLFFIQPESSQQSILYFARCIQDRDLEPAVRAANDEFTMRVLTEDFSILDRYVDPRLPLDIRSEVHTHEDLGGVEFRRLIREIHLLGGPPTPGTSDEAARPARRELAAAD